MLLNEAKIGAMILCCTYIQILFIAILKIFYTLNENEKYTLDSFVFTGKIYKKKKARKYIGSTLFIFFSIYRPRVWNFLIKDWNRSFLIFFSYSHTYDMSPATASLVNFYFHVIAHVTYQVSLYLSTKRQATKKTRKL